MPDGVSISVIIPVWREAQTIESTLSALQGMRSHGVELLVVDGGSDDGTPELAAPLCDRLIQSAPGRAVQMNAGAAEASGPVLLFLHADTRLPRSALSALTAFTAANAAWGRFDVRLSGDRFFFKVISWFINKRSRLTGIATGDQALFVRREVFERLGGYAAMPLMEDVELTRRLKAESRPFCVADPVITDSRRWQTQGAWRTVMLMWRLRWRYWRGESPETLARDYKADVRRSS